MNSLRALLLCTVTCLLGACAQSEMQYYVSFKGSTPPSLKGDGVQWLNAEPVDWSDLRGKIVLLEFSFLR